MSTPRDLSAYRKLFPVTQHHVYLNHAALSPVATPVLEAMQAHLVELAGHGIAAVDLWEGRLERVRATCARLIGAQAREVAFVRNTSHGLSLVSSGLAWRRGDNVLCATTEEYPSNVYAWSRLEPRGVEVRSVPAPGGRLDVEAFARAGDERTRLLAVSAVQYATGWAVDLPALGRLCAERGWLLCVDAIQSVGVLPMDVKACGIHFLAADSHKWMLGLAGIGIFYVDAALAEQLDPPLIGWRSMREAFNFDQVRLDLKSDALRFEEGNLPYVMIEGMGAAVDLLLEVGVERIGRRVKELNAHLAARLREADHSVSWPQEESARSGILCFQPRDGDSAGLVARLSKQGVVVSCRRGAVRVSPHFYTVEAEMDRVAEAAG